MNAKKTEAAKAKQQLTVAQYLEHQINLSNKTQNQIAKEVGFAKPNMITMIKQGLTKLPVSKVGLMAISLGIDPMHLFQMVMTEYEPETWRTLEKYVFRMRSVTQNELEILDIIREANPNNPKVRTEAERQKLAAAVKDLVGEDGISSVKH